MTYQADRLANFGTSIFTEIAALADQHQALRLSSGYPNTSGPNSLIEATTVAMQKGHNQYVWSHGAGPLRDAIARHEQRFYQREVNPDTEITVTAGATEALFLSAMAFVNPGDEVIVLEPYFEYYVPNAEMAGGVPRYVPLRAPDWTFDPDELAAAFNNKTKLIMLNTPHNPTGRVFTKAQLQIIADLCQKWDVIAVVDEVYEHLVYGDAQHVRLRDLPEMADRTITISSMSKTFSMTGWRIGWILASEALSNAVRLVHQFTVDCASAPLQFGCAAALDLPDAYYADLANTYAQKRDLLLPTIQQIGLKPYIPDAGFFIMADFSDLGFSDDVAFCKHLIETVGVATIPPSAFFSSGNKSLAKQWIRFAFCKDDAVLTAACERLMQLS